MTDLETLQQEIDDLKSSQGSQDQQNTGSTDPADAGQAADSGTGTQSSSGNTGSTSGVAVTLEEAQNIALERVPGPRHRIYRLSSMRTMAGIYMKGTSCMTAWSMNSRLMQTQGIS